MSLHVMCMCAFQIHQEKKNAKMCFKRLPKNLIYCAEHIPFVENKKTINYHTPAFTAQKKNYENKVKIIFIIL